MTAHVRPPGPAGSANRLDAAAFPPAELIEELLRSGVDVRLEVGGRSMRPLLAGGEIATVASAAPESLACGELVLCRGAGGRLVLHRLVAVSGTGTGRRWHTRGDALMACDEPFEARQVLGRVARIEGLRIGVAPAAANTDVLWWRAASRCFAAAAGASRVARRIAAHLERVTRSAHTRGSSRTADISILEEDAGFVHSEGDVGHPETLDADIGSDLDNDQRKTRPGDRPASTDPRVTRGFSGSRRP